MCHPHLDVNTAVDKGGNKKHQVDYEEDSFSEVKLDAVKTYVQEAGTQLSESCRSCSVDIEATKVRGGPCCNNGNDVMHDVLHSQLRKVLNVFQDDYEVEADVAER